MPSDNKTIPWYKYEGCFNPWDEEHQELNYRHILLTLIYIIVSFVCFRLLQFTVRWYMFGRCSFPTFSFFEFARRFRRRHHQRPPPASQSLKIVPPNKKWRISNEAVSLLHSVVSGLWALYSIMIYTQLIQFKSTYETEDGKLKRVKDGMRYFCHPMPQYLIFMSFGYLVHDFVDLVINERSMRIIELLFHHVVVIMAFSITLGTGQFLGVVILGLLMELNSIFLHSRSLLNLYKQPKESFSFRFVALVNIVTYFIFRIFVSFYLIYWLIWSIFFAEHDDRLGWGYIPANFIVIVSLNATNIVLLYRVMAADGLLGKKHARATSTEVKENAGLEEEEEELDLENEDEGSDVEAAQNEEDRGHLRNDSTQTGTDVTQASDDRVVVVT